MKKLITFLFLLFFGTQGLLFGRQTDPDQKLSRYLSQSDRLIEAEILKSRPFWNEAKTLIFTEYTLKVRTVFKGESGAETIQIALPGGRIGSTAFRTGSSGLRPGDAGIFVLKNGENPDLFGDGLLDFIRYDRYNGRAGSADFRFASVDDLHQKIENLLGKKGHQIQEKSLLFEAQVLAGGRTEAIDIQSFLPDTITGGTRSKLTITGLGFGDKPNRDSEVLFSSNTDGGATRVRLLNGNTNSPELISWSDTKIEVYVPAAAGSGEIAVINGNKEEFRTTDKLYVPFSLSTAGTFFGLPGTVDNSPAPNPDLSDINGEGGYTVYVSPELFRNENALKMLNSATASWRCQTGVNFKIAAAHEDIIFGFRGVSAISTLYSPPSGYETFQRLEFCDVGGGKEWHETEFQIFLDLKKFQSENIDIQSVIVHCLGRAALLERNNDPASVMYFKLNANEQKRTISAKEIAGTKVLLTQSAVVNNCGPKPMIPVSSDCRTAIDKPEAIFAADQTELCGKGTIAFEDKSRNAVTVNWIFEGGTPATSNDRDVKVNYDKAGKYKVTMQVQNPAGTAETAKEGYITVGDPAGLAVDLGANRTVCPGEAVVLDAGNAGAEFAWSNGAVSQKIEVKFPGVYSVEVRKNGCSVNAEVRIDFKEEAEAGTSRVICEGMEVKLSAKGGKAYRWIPAAGLSDATAAEPTVSPLETTTYYVDITTESCGIVRDSMRISVDPLPVLNLQDSLTVCNESRAFINVPFIQNAEYLWSTGQRGSGISVREGGQYWVQVTTANDCVVIDSTFISFSESLTADAGRDTTFCEGEKVQLQGKGGLYYRWSPQEGLSNAFIANPVAEPKETTTYTLTVFGGNCESTPDEITVTVLPKPTLNLGRDTLSCAAKIELDAQNPGATYEWSDGSRAQTLSVTKSGEYFVRVYPKGCTGFLDDTIKVEFIRLDLGADTLRSCGEKIMLKPGLSDADFLWSDGSTGADLEVSKTGMYRLEASVKACGNTLSDSVFVIFPELDLGPRKIRTCSESVSFDAGNPGAAYLWSDGSTGQKLTVRQAGEYFVEVRPLGCEVVLRDTVQVDWSEFAFQKDTLISCENGLTLRAGLPGATYLWSDKSTADSLFVSQTGVYSLTVSDTCGSVHRDSIFVRIDRLENPFATDTLRFCEAPAVLSAKNKYAKSYEWPGGETGQNFTVSEAGPVRLTVRDNCEKEAVFETYVIFETPTLDFAAGDTLKTCGDSLVLDAKNSGAEFNWSDGSREQTLTVRESGRYFAEVKSLCGPVLHDTVYVFFGKKPVADFDFILEGTGIAVFTDKSTSAAGDTYAWDFGDGNQSNERAPQHTYNRAGNYSVKLLITNKLCGKSLPISKDLSITVAGTENLDFADFSVFPNPSEDGVFSLRRAGFNGNLEVRIFRADGAEVYRGKLKAGQNRLQPAGLTSGFYIAEFVGTKGSIRKKLMVK